MTARTVDVMRTESDADWARGWTPVRRGTTYCSPRCGAGCTLAAYRRASTAAQKLANKLNRGAHDGWRPVVWENMGWHWIVARGKAEHHSGQFELHKYGEDEWSAWYNGFPQTIVQGETPKGALRLLMVRMRAQLQHFNRDIEKLESACERL